MHFTNVLSIELDSVLMEKRKPKDKLVKARHLIQSHKTIRNVSVATIYYWFV